MHTHTLSLSFSSLFLSFLLRPFCLLVSLIMTYQAIERSENDLQDFLRQTDPAARKLTVAALSEVPPPSAFPAMPSQQGQHHQGAHEGEPDESHPHSSARISSGMGSGTDGAGQRATAELQPASSYVEGARARADADADDDEPAEGNYDADMIQSDVYGLKPSRAAVDTGTGTDESDIQKPQVQAQQGNAERKRVGEGEGEGEEGPSILAIHDRLHPPLASAARTGGQEQQAVQKQQQQQQHNHHPQNGLVSRKPPRTSKEYLQQFPLVHNPNNSNEDIVAFKQELDRYDQPRTPAGFSHTHSPTHPPPPSTHT